jgi:hypothetical protein
MQVILKGENKVVSLNLSLNLDSCEFIYLLILINLKLYVQQAFKIIILIVV